MKEIKVENINETIYFEELDNGLQVYFLHKKGFQKNYATFTTKYGSIDSSFKVNQLNYKLPDGIAHFLEHKMFEKKEGDIFHKFAINGAQANAFTSFNRTTYLFSSTEKLLENIQTLLDFVQEPYFTEESVEKEKGIIAQEIRMYEDDPDWRVFFSLLQAIYSTHPIRIDIAGTVDSITRITREDLYSSYNTFYHPSNMLLFIVADSDPERVINFVRENQAKKSFTDKPVIQRYYPMESAEINTSINKIYLSVANPKALIGFKDMEISIKGLDFLKQEISTQILLEILFGKGSDLFENLLNDGLIDEDFSHEYTIENNYGFSLVGGNSIEPNKLFDLVTNEIYNFKSLGVSDEKFEQIKRKKIGDFLRKMNSPEFIANQFARYIFNNALLFDILNVLETLDSKDVNQRINHLETGVLSIVLPR